MYGMMVEEVDLTESGLKCLFESVNPLTSLLPNGYSYKASCARPG